VVGGGRANTVEGDLATVGGGENNRAIGTYSTIGGGKNNRTAPTNTTKGLYATVPGGRDNVAEGNYSFAAGRGARALDDGSFVLADSTSTTITSTNADEVRSQMDFYAQSFNTTSARARKTAVEPVDPGAMLSGVESVSVSTWEFERDEDGDQRHVGPMAGEFHETFGVGDDDGHISTVDADGVALAAIQGLAGRLDEGKDRLDDLADDADRLEDQREQVRRVTGALEGKDERIARLKADNERKRERIAALERETEALRERGLAIETRLAEIAGEELDDVAKPEEGGDDD